MIIDLIIIIFFIISCYMGYRRGVLKELYDLIILVGSILLALSFKMQIGKLAFSKFYLKELLENNFDENIAGIIESFSTPFVGLIFGFIFFYIVIKFIFFVLKKTNLLKERAKKFNYIGSVLSALKAVFFVTFVAFIISFSFIIDKEDIYENSFLLRPILKLNPPLHNLSIDLSEIYTDLKTMQSALENKEEIDSIEEITKIIKKVKETDLVNDETLENLADGLIFNEEQVDLSNLNIEEIKEAMIVREEYEIIQNLHKEDVITTDLILRVLENNKIEGITEEDIEYLFE